MISYLTVNNHYGFAVDQFFSMSSIIIFLISMVCFNKKAILIAGIAVLLSIAMNIFNIGISYQKWIERGQPTVFTQ